MWIGMSPTSSVCWRKAYYLSARRNDIRIDLMSDPERPANTKPAAVGSERAPFVFCDGVLAYGTSGGLVQVELAANTLVEDGEGGVSSVPA